MAIHLVQFNPEIPHNTINIMKTCVGAKLKLHLIKPLGFLLDEKNVKNAGIDFIDDVDYTIYENWDEFSLKNEKGNFYFCTQNGQNTHTEIDFSSLNVEHYIILGAESTGFPLEILKPHLEKSFRVPMKDNVCSLNVSSVGAIVAYEALRQQGFPNL